MDNDLAANDPYREMNTGEDEIRPEFLRKNKNSAAQGILNAAEQVALAKAGGKAPTGGAGAAEVIRDAETADAVKHLYNGGENGPQKVENDENKSRVPTSVKIAAPFIIIVLAVFAIIGLVIALPVMMIGAIDYNLQKALGFTHTVGILEEQGEYVTAEMLGKGNVPSQYASDLASNGMEVGQLLANGDFVRTDTYIANIDERNDLVASASGFVYSSNEEGELALLYDGNIIKAGDFVAAVESDPKLYAAYSAAADLSAKYYYSDDVTRVYNDMQLSRGNFNNWEATGDYKVDEESYLDILYTILDANSPELQLGGVHEDTKCIGENCVNEPNGGGGTGYTPPKHLAIRTANWPEWKARGEEGTFVENVSEGEAEEITNTIAEKTKEYIIDWDDDEEEEILRDKDGKEIGRQWHEWEDPVITSANESDAWQNATHRAAELLNTAVSSREPYIASSAFIAIEEPINRARIGNNGPINQVMNTLSTPTSVTYQDVQTGEEVTKNISIFETTNFQAAVGEKPYSTEEAANFARDRVLQTTGQADKQTIKHATVSSDGRANSTTAVRNGLGINPDEDHADVDTISKANSSINLAISRKNSVTFSSVVGANRILEGGSFLSNNINQHVLGSMPSDAATVADYQSEVNKVMARKEEADRASRSPFDISSPNTFLGSIVHNLATTMIGVYGSGATSMLSTVRAAGNVTGDAVAGLFGTANAESWDQQFTGMSPSNCETVQAVSTVGDLYCTSHNTNNTDYMDYTREGWMNTIVGDSIDGDGNIIEGSALEQFVTMGMDRPTTVGVKSAEVCQRYHEYNDTLGDKIKNLFASITGTYEICKTDDDEEFEKFATGAVFTRGPEGGTEGEEGGGETRECTEGGPITYIGDSISNMAQDQIRALLPEVDFTVEDGKAMQKNFWSGSTGPALEILEKKKSENDIKDFVVIQIGTNNFLDSAHPEYDVGWLKDEYFDKIKEYVGDKKVVLVTNYDGGDTSRFNQNNEVIANAVSKYGWTVANWHKIATLSDVTDADHDYGYKVHLTDQGKQKFANMIYRALVAAGYKGGCGGAGGNGEIDVELFTAYILYDEVHSLLSGESTAVARAREQYYAKHPQDNSEAAVLARRSGMTKYEAEIALAYEDYLIEIAMYDASNRYQFGELALNIDQPILKHHSDETTVNLYAWYQKEVEYKDVRNRQEMTA